MSDEKSERDKLAKEIDKVGKALTYRIANPVTSKAFGNFMKKWDKVHKRMARSVEDLAEKAGHTITCSSGCSVCCENLPIPAFWFEIARIGNHTIKDSEDSILVDILMRVKKLATSGTKGCPFLIKGFCAVYDIRPAMCRLMLGDNCESTEDKYKGMRLIDIPDKDLNKHIGDRNKQLRKYLKTEVSVDVIGLFIAEELKIVLEGTRVSPILHPTCTLASYSMYRNVAKQVQIHRPEVLKMLVLREQGEIIT